LLGRQVSIDPGSHGVKIDGGQECPSFTEPSLTYAHYPVRSPYQWLSKSIIGWAKVLAAGPEMIRTGNSLHYRDPFEALRIDPQRILRNKALMETLTARDGIGPDPIIYRGGELRYTPQVDYQMHSVQVVMQYLYNLASQHGVLMEAAARLGDAVGRDEADFKHLL
jgi:hypothetical protein